MSKSSHVSLAAGINLSTIHFQVLVVHWWHEHAGEGLGTGTCKFPSLVMRTGHIAILRCQYFVIFSQLPAQKGGSWSTLRLGKHTAYISFCMKLPVEGEVRRSAPYRITSSMDGRRLSILLLWMHPVRWQVSLSRTKDAAGWYAGDLRFYFPQDLKGFSSSWIQGPQNRRVPKFGRFATGLQMHRFNRED